MTLIASSAAYDGCIQLADRMVSIDLEEFDPQANKSILLLMDNAAVAISYTGMAYIGQMPTDEWLVERIIGQPLFRWPDGAPAAMSIGPVALMQADFSRVMLSLKRSVNEAFLSNLVPPGKPHERRLELAIVGWMWKRSRRDRARPVLCHLTRESKQPAEIHWAPRHAWAPSSRGAVVRCGTWAPRPPDGAHEKIERLMGSGGVSLQILERHLAKLMRTRASECSGYISSDLMVTRIPHPRLGVAYIEYLPSPAAQPSEFAAIGFSPWIIAKNCLHAPSAQIGVVTICAPGWEVKTGRPGRFQGLVGGLLAQRRRKWP